MSSAWRTGEHSKRYCAVTTRQRLQGTRDKLSVNQRSGFAFEGDPAQPSQRSSLESLRSFPCHQVAVLQGVCEVNCRKLSCRRLGFEKVAAFECSPEPAVARAIRCHAQIVSEHLFVHASQRASTTAGEPLRGCL